MALFCFCCCFCCWGLMVARYCYAGVAALPAFELVSSLSHLDFDVDSIVYPVFVADDLLLIIIMAF